MKHLVKKKQFIALIAAVSILTLLVEMLLTRFFGVDKFESSQLLFKGISHFLFFLLIAFLGLLYFGYKDRQKQAEALAKERDKSPQTCLQTNVSQVGY